MKKWLFLLFIALVGFFYASTLLVNHGEAEDVLNYAAEIRDLPPSSLFRANHLLFSFFSWTTFQTWKLFGYQGSPLLPMQINSVIAAMIVLYILYVVCQRLKIDNKFSFLVLLSIVSSYGFWIYSIEGDTYIIPLIFTSLCLLKVIDIAEGDCELRHFFTLGFYHAMATLFHQQNVLLFPVIALTVCFNHRSKGRIKGLGLFALTSCALIGVAYFGVSIFLFGASSLDEVILWSRGISPYYVRPPFSLNHIIKGFIGIFHTVWGILFMFGFDSFNQLLGATLKDNKFLEERFLASTLTPLALWSSLILTVMSIVSALFLALLACKKVIFKSDSRRAAKTFIVLMLIVYALFNFIWEPLNIEFWIAIIPFFFLLLFLWISFDSKRLLVGYTFAITLFASNLIGSILPQTSTRGDFWYQSNLYLIQRVEKGDLIVTGADFIGEKYLRYYTSAEVFSVLGKRHDALEAAIRSHDTGRIFISSWAMQPPLKSSSEWIKKRYDLEEVTHALLPYIRNTKPVSDNGYQKIWIIRPNRDE